MFGEKCHCIGGEGRGGLRRLIANVLILFNFSCSLPNYANVLFVLKIFNLSLRCEKKGPQYIDFRSSDICCIYWCMPLVCAWLVGLANTERGGADQSRKVLCFVDFKLRQEKTFANKLARYLLTKLRNRQAGMCGLGILGSSLR